MEPLLPVREWVWGPSTHRAVDSSSLETVIESEQPLTPDDRNSTDRELTGAAMVLRFRCAADIGGSRPMESRASGLGDRAQLTVISPGRRAAAGLFEPSWREFEEPARHTPVP